MGARLINNPRQTNRGHINDFPRLDMSSIRKTLFHEGRRTDGTFGYTGISYAFTISVDLCFEHDLKVILGVESGDSAANYVYLNLAFR